MNKQIKDYVRGFLRHDVGPWGQFIKYGIAGGTATVVHITIFFLLGWRLLPALTYDDIMVQLLGVIPVQAATEGRRALNAALATGLAFLVANAVAYTLNVMFVFRRGRHARVIEIMMFYAVSAISVVIGTVLQSVLIVQFGIMTTIAFGTNILASLMINFAVRKYLIFSRQ